MTSRESEFKTLTEVGTLGRGKSKHRPRNDPDLYGGEYPFVQTGDVKHAPFYLTEYTQTYNEKGLAQSKLWTAGTLCITIAANIADTAILAIPACFPDSILGFTPHRQQADVRYVKYCLDAFRGHMEQISKGTTQDNLSMDKLLKLRFWFPAYEVQRRIAALLTAYDDLISNNQRRIALLESMAEEIYREWFVRMRFPGYEGAEFFAGRPVAWRPRRLGQVLQLRYGKALPEGQRVPGPYRVYGSAGAVGTHSEALVTKPSIVVGRKGNVGSIFWASKPFYPIDTVYYVESELPLIYLRFLLAGTNFINSDAAVPGLNREQAYANEVLLPQDSLLSKFEEVVGPLYRQVEALEDQVACLGSTRDALLPRLIAGKLRVDHLDIQFPPSMQPPAEAALAEALA